MTPEAKSKIEELKKSLYSRNAPDINEKRRLHFEPSESNEVKTDWEHPPEKDDEVVLNSQYKDPSMSFFTKLLIGSVLFFIVSLGIGTFLLLNGENIISANNIEVSVDGPVTTAGGDPVTFNIEVHNKNNVKLQNVNLQVSFPPGTVDPVDRSKELKEYNQVLEDISPGGSQKKSFNAVMYGEENLKKDVVINISYKVAGSNAVFKKQKTYEVLISSSPLSISVDSFKEVISGQEFEMGVVVVSNSDEIIRNLLLKASYPFGFTYISSNIQTQSGNNTWNIGDIPPKSKKTIKIKGKLEGQDDEIRNFNFALGAPNVKNPTEIATEYTEASQEISIKKPFLTTSISMNDDSNEGEYVGSFNAPIKVTVSWFNNIATAITDGEIHVKISGSAFDKASVVPGDGYYKSADNEIVWNKVTTSSLSNIGPGESGSITFSITPRDFSTPTKTISNPSLSVEVSVQGKRLSETNVPESIASNAKRSVKVSSQVGLSAQVVRSLGLSPFENTGPIPPKAEKTTTYTVLWTINNTSNTVNNAEVRASLPAYVKWVGKTSPSDEDIVYNSNTNQISWKIGDISTYTSNSSKKRQVAFMVSIDPSVAQVGQVPTLVSDATLTGQDDFTGDNLTSSAPSVTTRFIGDPAYKDGNDVVVP